MANVINATSTGNGGLVSTGDDSGILNIQTNETTAISINASQGVEFLAGTAALPAITTAGDTNTGIFFPTADTIAFSEGGTEAMRINSSAQVGIGTTSQNEKLVVNGAIRSTNNAVGATATADSGVFYFVPTADAPSDPRTILQGVGTAGVGASIAFFTGTSSSNTERMRINAGAPILCLAGGSTTATGTGIAFPATQSASSDANTLDDYEEGTWTPNQGSGIVLVGTFSSSAKYTKIGRQVTLVGQVQGSTSVANVTNGGRLFTNAPFSASPSATGVLTNDAQSQAGSGVLGGTDFYINPMSATPIIYFTITYFV